MLTVLNCGDNSSLASVFVAFFAILSKSRALPLVTFKFSLA